MKDGEKVRIPEADKATLKAEFAAIDAGFAVGLLTMDDVRLWLSKLYSAYSDVRTKNFILHCYDALEGKR